MIDLLTLATGDTDYIHKHNSNYANVKAAIESLEALYSGAVSASQSGGASGSSANAFRALFGDTVAVVGASSYACTGGGTTLTVQPGYCWKPSLSAVVSTAAITQIAFSGQVAATYYVQVDAAGVVSRSPDITEALYSVVWTGTSFGAITRLAKIVWGAADDIAAQTSTALGTTYTSMDARMEAGETKAVAGDKAYTWMSSRTTKSIAGGANATLTDTEARNFAIDFTGAITANLTITLPSTAGTPRGWVVRNSTSGNYTVTLKGSSGAGIKLPRGVYVWVMYDAYNLYSVREAPGREAIASLPYTANVTADFSFADTVRVTLGGAASITLAGAEDGQKCILELTQGGVGGYPVTFGPEVRYGADLTLLDLSTIVGKTDKIGFIYDSASGKYDAVAIMRGF